MKIFSAFFMLLLAFALSPEASHAKQLRAPAEVHNTKTHPTDVIIGICENLASAYTDLANTINALPQSKTFQPDPDFQLRTLLISKKRIVRETITKLECHFYTSLNLEENIVKSKEEEIPLCSLVPDIEKSYRMYNEGTCKGVPRL